MDMCDVIALLNALLLLAASERTLSGRLFQQLDPRYKNERRLNSVRTRGSSNRPSEDARVRRSDTSERRITRSRVNSGAHAAVRRSRIRRTSCSKIIPSILNHPSSCSRGVTWSRYPAFAMIRAAKFNAFCTRRFCVAVQLPQTDKQYRIWGNTSASISSRLVWAGRRYLVLARPMRRP